MTFSRYPVGLTEKGKRFLRFSNEGRSSLAGRYLQPIRAEEVFTIEGIQTKDQVRKVRFSNQIKVVPELESCMFRGTLDLAHFEAEFEKFDTGWVVSRISRIRD